MNFLRALMTAIMCCVAFPVVAGNLDTPSGRILLTISGAIEQTNQGDTAIFDQAMLEGLDWKKIETHTAYTHGLQTFSGPTLASLLAALGVTGGDLRAVALDDYAIDIPVADLENYEILLAMEHNGAPMRVRNRGPIWLLYPAPTEADLNERHKSHSIWQLSKIAVTR